MNTFLEHGEDGIRMLRKRRRNSMSYVAGGASGQVYALRIGLVDLFVRRKGLRSKEVVPGVSLLRWYSYLKCITAGTDGFRLRGGRDLYALRQYGVSRSTVYRYMGRLVDMGLARKVGVGHWHLPEPKYEDRERGLVRRYSKRGRIVVSKSLILDRLKFEGFIFLWSVHRDVEAMGGVDIVLDRFNRLGERDRRKIWYDFNGLAAYDEDALLELMYDLGSRRNLRGYSMRMGATKFRGVPGYAEGSKEVSCRFIRSRIKVGNRRILRGIAAIDATTAIRRWRHHERIAVSLEGLSSWMKASGIHAFHDVRSGQSYAVMAQRIDYRFVDDGFIGYGLPWSYREFLKRKWIRNRGYEGSFWYHQMKVSGKDVVGDCDWVDGVMRCFGEFLVGLDISRFSDFEKSLAMLALDVMYRDCRKNDTDGSYSLDMSCLPSSLSIGTFSEKNFFDSLIRDYVYAIKPLNSYNYKGLKSDTLTGPLAVAAAAFVEPRRLQPNKAKSCLGNGKLNDGVMV